MTDKIIEELFTWNYTIGNNLLPVIFCREQAKDETYISANTTIGGIRKAWYLRMDFETGEFKFTTADLPQSLKDDETVISDAIMGMDA